MTEEPVLHPTANSPAPLPSAAGSRPFIITASVAALIILGMVVSFLRTEPRPARASNPVAVAGDHIDIAQGAPTWGYLEFAQAGLDNPIPPEPVPARVAFDEMRSSPVVAPLPGRVDAVVARIGQRVQQGDRLLSIRSTALVDLKKEISLMSSEEAAKAKAVERLRSLVALKAEPEKDLIAAEQDLRQAQLAREAAELKLRSLPVATADDSVYWLPAPRNGVIVQRDVLVGQEVGPDRGEPLLVVAELDEVIVTADVPESEVAGLQIGQTARVLSPLGPEDGFQGKVEYIGEVVDPLRRMVEVRIRVSNPDRILRANAFVQVAFAPVDRQRVVIPAEAVVTDDQQSFVFVRPSAEGNGLERRRVALGRQQAGRVEITSGLKPGETYVTKGAILLLNAVDLASK